MLKSIWWYFRDFFCEGKERNPFKIWRAYRNIRAYGSDVIGVRCKYCDKLLFEISKIKGVNVTVKCSRCRMLNNFCSANDFTYRMKKADHNNDIQESIKLRLRVFKRDKYKCVYCGSKKKITLDHVIPHSNGGKTELNNLVTCCNECNNKKGNRTQMKPKKGEVHGKSNSDQQGLQG